MIEFLALPSIITIVELFKLDHRNSLLLLLRGMNSSGVNAHKCRGFF